ncbi:MAG: hypothetical protein V2B18_09710 [Pseudomonadota bacterium]
MARDDNEQYYTVTITGLMDDRSRAVLAQALTQLTRNLPVDRIELKLENDLPWTLTRTATAKRAKRLVEILQRLGAVMHVMPPLPEFGFADIGQTELLTSTELLSESQLMSTTQFLRALPDEGPESTGIIAAPTSPVKAAVPPEPQPAPPRRDAEEPTPGPMPGPTRPQVPPPLDTPAAEEAKPTVEPKKARETGKIKVPLETFPAAPPPRAPTAVKAGGPVPRPPSGKQGPPELPKTEKQASAPAAAPPTGGPKPAAPRPKTAPEPEESAVTASMSVDRAGPAAPTVTLVEVPPKAETADVEEAVESKVSGPDLQPLPRTHEEADVSPEAPTDLPIPPVPDTPSDADHDDVILLVVEEQTPCPPCVTDAPAPPAAVVGPAPTATAEAPIYAALHGKTEVIDMDFLIDVSPKQPSESDADAAWDKPVGPEDFEPLSLGGILDRGFNICRAHFLKFMTIMVIPWAITIAIIVGVVALAVPIAASARYWDDSHLLIAAFVALGAFIALCMVSLGVMYLSQGALIYAVSSVYLGRRIAVGEAYRFVFSRLGRFVGTTLLFLVSALVLVAAVLLMGFIFYLISKSLTGSGRWSIFTWPLLLTIPFYCLPKFLLFDKVVIIENRGGFRALARSWDLVSGQAEGSWPRSYWTRLVILLNLLFILQVTISLLFGLPTELMQLLSPDYLRLVWWGIGQILGLFGGLVATMFVSVWTVLFYYDIRNRKEAFDLDMLARLHG